MESENPGASQHNADRRVEVIARAIYEGLEVADTNGAPYLSCFAEDGGVIVDGSFDLHAVAKIVLRALDGHVASA